MLAQAWVAQLIGREDEIAQLARLERRSDAVPVPGEANGTAHCGSKRSGTRLRLTGLEHNSVEARWVGRVPIEHNAQCPSAVKPTRDDVLVGWEKHIVM